MSANIFDAALTFAQDQLGTVTLGGGEPTIHRDFPAYLDRAIDKCKDRVAVITNGKAAEPVRFLLDRAKRDKVAALLSLDVYHEPIDPGIVMEFRSLPGRVRWAGVDVPGAIVPPEGDQYHVNLVRMGRARHGVSHCICAGPFITPNGDIRQCGCAKHAVGHVQDWRGFVSRFGHKPSCARAA
jgi:hypothetical protein